MNKNINIFTRRNHDESIFYIDGDLNENTKYNMKTDEVISYINLKYMLEKSPNDFSRLDLEELTDILEIEINLKKTNDKVLIIILIETLKDMIKKNEINNYNNPNKDELINYFNNL